MKQIITAVALFAMAISFASCEKDVTCNCQCGCCNTENTDQGNNRPDNGNNGGSNNDNTGNIDRGEYEVINNSFTKAQAGYYGVYYDEQPSNTTNWYLELADDDYDFDTWEGDGYNIALEFFSSSSSATSIPEGTYTVEAFEESEFSAGSLIYSWIAEDETYGEYAAGTWLYQGSEGIAGATAGKLTVSKNGSTYTFTYNLYDDEYQIAFSGSYSGSVDIYDGTQDYSYAQAKSVKKAHKASTRVYKVRR